jgi:type IV secretory pathway VirB4 component
MLDFFSSQSDNDQDNTSVEGATEYDSFVPDRGTDSGSLDIKDIIAPSALKISPKELNLGQKVARTFFVVSFPETLSSGWFSPVINLDRTFDASIHIHPKDTQKVLEDFEKKVAEIQSQINIRSEKGMVRDPKLDSARQNLEKLRDDLQQAREKMFDVGVYITIYGEDEDDLNDAESELRSVLESQMVYIKPALFQQEQGFHSTMPEGKDELEVHTQLNTSPISSMFPFVSFDLTSNNGILYGINRHNSGLILFDRFSMPNYNSVTFATSGAGKSYATKLEILRSLMFDTDVIVIDPEKEYDALAEAVGGRYFNVSLNSENHINPFDIPKPQPDEAFSDVLRSNIISLVGLFRMMFGGLTPEEDSIVDKAITETYALKDITYESEWREDMQPPLLSDFEMVLEGMTGTDELVQKLKKYTEGSWSGFMNKPTNIDIDQKFVVFSVRDMEDELKPIAMHIIMQNVWSNVRKNLKKRLLVIDEAWWMMQSEDTASFLFKLAKRGRKYYLGLATITQDVGDFLDSEYGMPIVTNSSIQLLMKQSPSVIDRIQETFNLTDEEKYLLLESDVGEGIFFAGRKHAAIDIVASYTEDQIITSDPQQLLDIESAREQLEQEKGGDNPPQQQ